jgi:hypothetical protein
MESIREITARGSGHWGYHAYNVELATRTTTWTDSAGTQTRTLLTYELLIPVREVGTRSFSTEEERRAFLSQSFSDLTAAGLEPPQRHPVAHPLAGLVGQRLDSVDLVADYAQLRWGEKRLNVYAAALIQSLEGHTRHCAPEYADRLHALAGQELVKVDELLDRGLVLTFANSTELVIPLSNDGTDVGPEAAEYSGGAIWDAGEPPFD